MYVRSVSRRSKDVNLETIIDMRWWHKIIDCSYYRGARGIIIIVFDVTDTESLVRLTSIQQMV